MPADLPFVFAWFRRKGFNQRTALRLALWCIDGSPAPGWTHKEKLQ